MRTAVETAPGRLEVVGVTATGQRVFSAHYDGTTIDAQKSPFVPDKLVLPPGLDASGASQAYISACWTRIAPATLGNTPATFPLKNQNGTTTNYTIYSYWGVPNGTTVTLYGHQTIVFFLGGMKDPSGIPIGFSASPTHPMDVTVPTGGAAARKGPYYEFPADRLQYFALAPGGTTTTNSNLFPSFIDVYGTQPYIYFSAQRAGNDYANVNVVTALSGSPTSGNISPYQLSANRFVNPNGFQIISAGKNQVFNSGGLNWPGGGGTTTTDGYYNFANFHPTMLGIANN